MSPFTCIDLFCGCGGFSLGMERAGFHVLAAIDFNHEAVQVFRANFPNVPNVLEADLTKYAPSDLGALIESDSVDVIVGGPPCQGFSTVRQRDGANHGPRLVHDQRRHLYEDFLRYVAHFKPRVFVMENVLGIRSAAGGEFFTRLQTEARALGYRVHSQIEKAIELGVPQKRQRQLIVGTRLDQPGYFRTELQRAPRAITEPTLGHAICDLPIVRAGGGSEKTDYDLQRRKTYLQSYGRKYLFDTLEVERANHLTSHRARPHSERDLRDFDRLREGENCGLAMKRGVKFEFPYDKSTFKDRYTRQHRDRPCSTIVAHMSKDGLMFIHPTQNRSLTPREAARVQSFPDWFEFPIARTHQYRVIGNAVPPLVAEAVGIAVGAYLDGGDAKARQRRAGAGLIPVSQKAAAATLLALISNKRGVRPADLSKHEFVRAWYAVGYLYAGLHPDSALDHGTETRRHDGGVTISGVKLPALAEYYTRSGWPVALAPLAKEAWRRFDAGELGEDEFYCVTALRAGMTERGLFTSDADDLERERMLA